MSKFKKHTVGYCRRIDPVSQAGEAHLHEAGIWDAVLKQVTWTAKGRLLEILRLRAIKPQRAWFYRAVLKKELVPDLMWLLNHTVEDEEAMIGSFTWCCRMLSREDFKLDPVVMMEAWQQEGVFKPLGFRYEGGKLYLENMDKIKDCHYLSVVEKLPALKHG